MKIFKHGLKTWKNLHGNISQNISDFYDLANETSGTPLQNYNDTTKGIQKLIKDAISSGIPIRPLGGNWSLSPIAATPGILLNTKALNTRFPISKESTSPQYEGESKKLLLAQCGTGIWELHQQFCKQGLSLSAVGASNGQTIAGAIATGTHGSALNFGAIHDAVVGLHIITGHDKHIWLERACYPVIADSLAAKLGATIIRDDEAFDAAVVGLGAFGFVHGVMVEAENQFLLEAYLRRVPYDAAFLHQVHTLDFSYQRLPFPGERPFHFQFLINPYDLDKGVYMTTMYKRPYHTNYSPPKPNGDGVGPGDDAPCFIGKVGNALPAVVPFIVSKVATASLKPYEATMGTLAEVFNNTTLSGKVASAAVGLAITEVGKVVDILMKVNKTSGPFSGLFAFRFVKCSKALMAFTRFAPVTCVLELDGVQCAQTNTFYEAVWKALETAGIPFTFHWGKMNSLNPTRLQKMYGPNLQRFNAARAKILSSATLTAFSNDALKNWGIDKTSANGTVIV
jgi:hypothetical protein